MKCLLRLVVVFSLVLSVPLKSQAAIFTVTSTADSGRGTLRQAITTANGNGTADTIKFNIPTTGGGPATIAVLSQLPDITESLTIDGTTQPGSKANTNATGALNTVVNVIIDGTDAGGVEGIVIDRVNNCVVRGLNVRGFTNGIVVRGDAQNNKIEGNFVGTDETGKTDQGNSGAGVFIDSIYTGAVKKDRGTSAADNNLIGGSTPASRNLISGNGGDGIEVLVADNEIIEGNLIGTDVTGAANLGNSGNGILLDTATNCQVGSTGVLGNVISGNGANGISITNSSTGNVIRGNNIGSNGKLGIDLVATGEAGGTVTPNDAMDADSGPNNLTNFPTIQSAIQNGSSVAVKFSIQGAPSTTYDVDFFSSSAADPSGFGEGDTYLASTTGLLKTDSTGASNTLTTNITGNFIGKVITMTATDGAGNTSEFSSAVSVVDAPKTYTVNSTADTDDGACTTSTGGCTLREAINAANTHAGADNIKFNIPGGGLQTITLASGLAPITDPVTIDGYTQPGSSVNTLATGDNAKLMIQIQGTSGADTAFVTVAPNCTFRGLAINNFTKSHIIFIGNTVRNSKVVGCFLGTNATGTAAGATPASFSMVIQEGASANAVGGPAVADRNIISGNSCGINLFSGATANTIENNYVGVDATGTKAIPNSSCGLLLAASPEETVIGGTTSASRNIISGNGTGISIDNQGTDNNLVQGNYIGADVTGTKSIANTTVGIEITSGAQGNVVGGSTSNLANIICGSPMGINLDGNNAFNTTNNTVAGNYIGTNASFATGLGNTYGVRVTGGANGNLIGGTTAGAGNFISGNIQIGISIDGTGSSNNTVAGNLVGLSSSGTAIGNGSFGLGISISSGASQNTIGGTAVGSRNVISGHTDGTAIKITDAGSDNNTVAGNYIGVNLTGTAALPNGRGVTIANGAKNNSVGGLTVAARNVISGCEFAVGISDSGTTGNQVQGNYLGTNAAGTAVIANRFGVGIASGASQNTIGGTVSGAANLISGNTDGNIFFSGANNNTVAGNFIGTNATGTASMGNFTTSASVVLTDGSSNNTIGGLTSASRNIISGAAGHGVEIQGSTTGTGPFSTGNTVMGNYIGTDVTGSKAVPNGGIGVFIFAGATSNTIGGTVPSVGNLISGNGSSGILLKDAGTKNNSISGNVIGLDATRTQALGNAEDGITVTSGATNTTIGGLSAGQRNVISANGTGTAGRGIQFEGATSGSNTVIGNYIGTDATGTVALGNSREGVYCNDSPNNVIGGNAAGSRNLISGNGTFDTGSAGVAIIGANANGNIVQSNYIGVNAAGLAAIRNVREGVYVNGSNNQILSNIIGGNGLEGVRIATLFGDFTTGNTVKGNVIGVDIKGTKALPNTTGVLVDGTATKTTIGGPAVEDRNLISGNTGNGVQLDTDSNLVQGNFIGTTADGRSALANGGSGVLVRGSKNTVGGNTAALRNIISGNAQNNVGINGTLGNSPSGNKVQGNYIGLDFPGTGIVGGGRPGVAIGQGAHNNNIGGSGPGEGNVISGCQAGISILDSGSDNNVVQGNRIGTDPTGTIAMGNQVMGIEIVGGAKNNVIGGGTSTPGTGPGNIISGNKAEGVVIGDPGTTGNRVQGNVIGTSSSGGLNLGNGGAGIGVENGATGNIIGGASSGQSNVISFNAGDGVNVSGAGSTGNSVRTNRFNSNAGLSVNLQPSGESASKQTANDAGDADTGPNLLQNFPLVSSASISGSDVVLTVTLNSTAAKNFGVDLYKVNALGTGPFIFRATQNVTTNSGGNVTFSFTTAGASGDIFAVMATDPSGNSSEISPAFTVTGGAPLPLSLTTASPVQEGNAAAYSGTVSRGSASTASALSVNLVANPTGQLNLPLTVTIPAGSKSANFQFFVVNDSVFEPESQPVKVTASATNFISATAVVDVLDDDSSGGEVFAWGYNEFGQVGDGSTTDRALAVAVGLTNARSVAANGSHSVAVLADGSVRSWGYNGAGQLGDGTQTDRPKPVTVVGLANVQEVAAGWYHSLALKSDGTVWAWGYNSNGQLGDGTTTRRPKPVQVQGLTGVKAIAASVYYSLALKNDGTVWAWGSNFYGQLGDGTETDRLVPVQVNIPAVVTAISAGGGHSLFLKGNGTVWSCGWNNYGQLGQGTTTDVATPAKLNGISGCTGISAGYAHSIAVTGDGSVFGWGDNSYGQIGAKVKGNSVSPAQINALSSIASVEAGADFSVFIRTGGNVQSLGGDGHGQLGNGVIGTNSSSPANVLNLGGVGRAGAGYGHVVAIGEATGGALKPLGPSQRRF